MRRAGLKSIVAPTYAATTTTATANEDLMNRRCNARPNKYLVVIETSFFRAECRRDRIPATRARRNEARSDLMPGADAGESIPIAADDAAYTAGRKPKVVAATPQPMILCMPLTVDSWGRSRLARANGFGNPDTRAEQQAASEMLPTSRGRAPHPSRL